MIAEVFEVVPRTWRGLGAIPGSGLGLRAKYNPWDAERKFGVCDLVATESGECRSGLVLQGRLKPPDCPAFATRCTPDTPLGATMVSAEGACAAYYRYRRMPSP
jgi:hydrogenase expression/formation protein HypD